MGASPDRRARVQSRSSGIPGRGAVSVGPVSHSGRSRTAGLGSHRGCAGCGTMVDMQDLHVAPGPGLPAGLRVPAGEIVERFSRSSGPGGQGVNTADSRVQLSLDLATTTALNEPQRELALARLASSLSGTVVNIAASEHRAQRQNRRAARERLASTLRGALVPESVRRPTRPTYGSRIRRLDAKRQRSQTKANRRSPPGHD